MIYDSRDFLPNIHTNQILNMVNPYIRLAFYDILKPNSHIGERIIYDYEFIYIKNGCSKIEIDGNVYFTRPGDFYFIKPGKKHKITVLNEELVQPHIHFDLLYGPDSSQVPISFKREERMTNTQKEMIRADISSQFRDPFPEYIRFNDTADIEYLFFDVINIYKSSEQYCELLLKAAFLRLFNYILLEVSDKKVNGPSHHMTGILTKIKQYLENHLDRAVTQEELAELVHMDKSYISRLYRSAFGVTPIHYHQMQRVEKAKKMIVYSDLTLTEISQELGFNSLQDFSRYFKRIEGVSPSLLRRKME